MTIKGNRDQLIVFFAAVAARFLFHILTGFAADDAFITFRYAENLANGLGFVYNEGQKVLGTTTPLFTLLLAVFSLLSLKPLAASLVISLVSCGATAVMVYRLAGSLRFGRLAFVPVMMYILWPRSLASETCGMETAFFTMLATAAFYFQHRNLLYYALAAATLASVTRPEGLFIVGLLLAWNIWRHREYWLPFISIPVFILVPWLVFSYMYFGAVVPNSMHAKLALYSRFATSSFGDSIVYLMAWHNPFGWIMSALAAVGIVWLLKNQRYGYLELIWLVGMILFYAVGRTHIFFWYIVPVYPVYCLFSGACFPLLFDRLRFVRSESRLFTGVLAAVLAFALLAGNYRSVVFYAAYQDHLKNIHKSIGQYLRSHAGRNDLVAAEDLGYMGYYSGLRMLDRDGLISPEAVPYNRSGRYLDLIFDYRPDWVVTAIPSATSGFMDDPRFLEKYFLEKSFLSGPSLEYRLYALKRQASSVGEIAPLH